MQVGPYGECKVASKTALLRSWWRPRFPGKMYRNTRYDNTLVELDCLQGSWGYPLPTPTPPPPSAPTVLLGVHEAGQGSGEAPSYTRDGEAEGEGASADAAPAGQYFNTHAVSPLS